MSANPEDIDAEVNAALGLEPEAASQVRTPSLSRMLTIHETVASEKRRTPNTTFRLDARGLRKRFGSRNVIGPSTS